MSCATGVVLAAFCWARADGPFRVLPYLQNPATDAITVMWFSEASTTGQVAFCQTGVWSAPLEVPAVLASALDYHSSETNSPPPLPHPPLPYLHRVRLTGLRGPVTGLVNDKQVFLAHDDAPEMWSGARLVSGGKHYGHLEVNVRVNGQGKWEAVLTPVYAFPLMDSGGTVTGFERRTYADEVTIISASAPLLGQKGAIVTEW